MSENVFPFENPSDSLMDFDYMDELLLDNCWIQATNESEISNNNPSVSNPLFDPSFQWPKLESNLESHDEKPSKDLVLSPIRNSPKSHVKDLLAENISDLNKQWWLAQMSNSVPSLSEMDRLIYAINNIKHFTIDKNVLIQVWLPETRDGRKVLSTSQRLFSLEFNCPRLSNYRNISEGFCFPADGDAKHSVGLPGRVFLEKVPEWTPDVRLFKIEEYPRVSHAQEHDVRGSVAVPVFYRDVKDCIGVVEVIMTTEKSNYTQEIQSVCKALEAFDLRSSEDSNTQNVEVSNEFNHPALQEIRKSLKSACTTHNLPLAQTWIPCIQQGGKGGCRHSNENLIRCISTVDSASHVSDPRFIGFQEACSEHHLLIGQGVVGKSFVTNEPCYEPNVTFCTKTEYPLAHHAWYFDLHAAVALHLRTKTVPIVDFVLEFFLPVDCKNRNDQKKVVKSLLAIVQKICGSLRVVTEMESEDSDTERVTKVRETEDHGLGSGLGSGSGLEKRRAGAKMEKVITLEMLRQHFAGSLKDAAKNMGVCPTTLKRICRQHGIQRWPSRKIKKVGHSLRKIQLVMDSVHGGSGSFQIQSFYSNFPKLASPKTEIFDSKPADGANAATSGSQSSNSNSGNSLSGGTHHTPPPLDEESVNGGLKRTKIDTNFQTFCASNDQDQETTVNEAVKSQTLPLPPIPRVKPEGHLWRVKVTFGDDKIRFRMQKDWGFNDLLQEIAKRLSLNDISGYNLKYLDDDSEWVLLTCDADVEECIDVYRSFRGGTIRLTLREPSVRVGSSLGSNAPL